MPESVTVSDWGEITVAEKPDDLEWDGHVFTFWNTQPDGSGKTYSPGDTERLTGDLELYAMWTELITVNYDLNGGEGSLPDPVVGLPWMEVTIAAPKPDMKRDGYVFRCWNSQPTGYGKNYDPGDMETYVSSSTLYAMWEEPITVQYSANGGEGSVPEPHVGLSTLHVVVRPKPDDLRKKGCYFYSWNSQEKGRVPAVTGMPSNRSDISLDALRTGEVYISETKPQADGFTFNGWLITNGDDDSVSKMYNADDFGSMTDAERRVNEALFNSSRTATAVAQWTANYTVTYNVSGIPSGFDYPAAQTDSYPEGTVVPIKDKPTGFDEDAYEFIGWNSEDIDTAQSSFTVNGNIVITGEFRSKTVPPQPEKYTVTYLSGNDPQEEYTDADISGSYTLLGISDVGFTTPDGKTFDKWALVTPDGNGYPAAADAGDSIEVVSNVTYEAQWNSSTPVNTTATISYTSGLTEDFPGYNESCAQPFVINEVPTTVEYPVLGNDPDSESNPSFAPDGYEFAGWKLVSGTGGSSPRPTAVSGGAGADGLYHEGDTVATDALASGNVTLKAMWNCKLRYDANEGSGTLPENGSEITKYVGDGVTAASGGDLTRDGNAFDHWNTKADDSGAKYSAGQSFVIKDNTVLYAVYASGTGSEEPDDTLVTLTYNANGGTGTLPDEKQYSSGTTVNVAPKGDLARTGCNFKEWNTRPDGSGKGYQGDGSASFVITADTTLYAIWVDDSGKIIPSPGTGESGIPMIVSFCAVLLSLGAVSIVAVRQRKKREQHD